MKLVPFIVKNIIAPHGITDMSHALMNNNNRELFNLNLINVGIVELLIEPFHLNTSYDILFILFTILHFHYDFPTLQIKQRKIPAIVSCSAFLFSCILLNNLLPFNIGFDILLTYMTFIHVPNHYRENWFHIKKDIVLNFLLILITCCFFNSILDYHPDILSNQHVIDISKAIIISHIIYGEKYIKHIDL